VESQGPVGVKYIIWGVLGVIAILVTVKQLGFTPTKITTPGVSVELSDKGGIAPKPAGNNDAPPAENNQQLHSSAQQSPVVAEPGSQTGGAEPTPNIAGTWVGPAVLNIMQSGGSVVVQTLNGYGILLSVGQGALNGRNLSGSYTNAYMQRGVFSAIVSPDGTEMNVTDYSNGVPQSFVYRRR
jgi:hypothetical protein